MLKKFICLFLSFLFICQPFCFAIYDIDSIPVWSTAVETSTLPTKANKVELNLDSESAILMDENTGTILYEKNSHEKLRPASVTKVMTLLLIMESLDSGKIKLTDKVPCSSNARKMYGSQIWLNETEELTVDEMLKAICVVSANDCSMAMAEFIAGSEEQFVQMMNEKAKSLGMNDTTFKNCHGLDVDDHMTSSYDIALMSRELSMKHPKIHEYTKIWMDTLRDGKSQLVNTNKLVRFYSGCTGLKTGSTSLALFNLSATATKNEFKLIAVVMRGPTSQKRFDDAKKLLDYGFANYTNAMLGKEGDIVQNIEINKSKNKSVNLIISNNSYVLLNKGEEKNTEREVVLNDKISAPLGYREKVGEIKYKLNGEILGTSDIVVAESVDSKSGFDFIKEVMLFWIKCGR